MDYSTVIELDNVTVGDCIDWHDKCRGYVVINDGRVINLVDKDGNKRDCDYR